MQKHTAYEIKRLHDISLETVHAIHNLGIDTSTWDPILVHIVTDKMDPETYTAYMDARKNKRDLPSFEELITILESKFIALEPLNKKGKQHKQNMPAKENEPKHKEGASESRIKFARSYKTYAERICPLCKTNEHVLLTCKRFLNMTPETKVNTIKSMSLCSNCLFYHKDTCTSTKKCKVCNNAHHTVLHEVYDKAAASNNEAKPTTSQQRKTYHVAGNDDETMLATIELNIQSKDGTFMKMRCLLDPGSQINLITHLKGKPGSTCIAYNLQTPTITFQDQWIYFSTQRSTHKY
ncbi:hypothetical protein NE865_14106 [Phthorimaea operculella]|nr:hypothetical protein NE865_14106 [Phthorimaea operculella]